MTSSRGTRRRGVGWLAVGAVLVLGAGTSPAPVPPDPAASVPAAEPPEVNTLTVPSRAGAEDSARLTPHLTDRFSLVGVTWADPTAVPRARIEVRTRSTATGEWGDWFLVRTEERGPVEAGARRGGTEPVWVGASDGVAVRVDGQDAALPAGLRLDLVDPGTEGTTATQTPVGRPSLPTSAALAAVAATSGDAGVVSAAVSSSAQATSVPAPSVVRRSGWRADESIRGSGPTYGTAAKVLFVHHTVGSNSYSCSESAAIVRGVYTYHVRSKGWQDIGYNYLVDRCGTVFEGRYGGLQRPVIGAHTKGFNRNSVGVAVLGTHSSKKVSTAARAAIAHLALWRLGLDGVQPTGTSTLVSASTHATGFVKGRSYRFSVISGHRDGTATSCPGNALYGQLPGLRTLATKVTGLKVGEVSGATKKSGVYRAKGKITLSWTVSTPSRLLSRYQVLVDGKVFRATSGSTRTATIGLATGDHTVKVRATHLSGRTSTTSALKIKRVAS